MARLRAAPIDSSLALDDAARRLAAQCPIMAALYRANGPPPERTVRANFSGLAQIICGQQVSAASAAAIWRRVSSGIRPFSANAVCAASDQDLAALGLSRPKIKTLQALAAALRSGDLDIRSLNRSADEAVIERLTALHGIGPWTADIYLLFALNRPNAFPVGDLALQLAAGRLFGGADRVAPAELLSRAEQWRPWRAIAARMLWHDYARQRARPATKDALKSRPSRAASDATKAFKSQKKALR